MVSINSVCFNKSHSMLTTKLKISIENNNIVIPYKIDTGSDRNIMPWYIFKKLSPRVTNYQHAEKKFMGLESAVQTWIAFSKLLTITMGQLLILM